MKHQRLLLAFGMLFAFPIPGTSDDPKEKPDSKAKAEKSEKPTGKLRIPGAEQTAAEIAFFQLPRDVKLDKSQKSELHQIYTSIAPQIASIRQEQQQLELDNRQYMMKNSSKKGARPHPDYAKMSKALQDQLAAISKAAKKQATDLLTADQKAKFGVKDSKDDADGKKADPKKKKKDA